MNLEELEPLIKIAKDAGYVIDKNDYGCGVSVGHPAKKVATFISEVFREDRDGYTGWRVITEANLRAWMKANPI